MLLSDLSSGVFPATGNIWCLIMNNETAGTLAGYVATAAKGMWVCQDFG